MTDPQREALASLRFNSAETPDHIWITAPYHVDGLHEHAEQRIRGSIDDANWSVGPSPIGLVLQGQKGVGKTHLLGWVRREVQRQQGYFFLIPLNLGDTFWADTAAALQSGLHRTDDSGETQLALFLRRLCVRIGTNDAVTKAIAGDVAVTGDDLQVFMSGLRRLDPVVSHDCGDTARALVLMASMSPENNTIGQDYLSGKPAQDDHGRQRWSMRRDAKHPRDLVQEISRLLALTGPSVTAVDQFDTLIAKATQKPGTAGDDTEVGREIATVADGLMQLRERTRRTLSLVACLPITWKLLRDKAVDSVPDRFEEPIQLGRIVDPDRARAFVEAWLGIPYDKVGFDPPHPTWPVAEQAFVNWDEYTARGILQRIRSHADSCLRGEIRELTSFDPETRPEDTPAQPLPRNGEPDYFAEFDERFARLRAAAPVQRALNERTEDEVMPGYLSAALRAWITEIGNDDMSWEAESQPGDNTVHAGLSRVLDETLDIEEHWAFRAIAATHHLSALKRLRNAKAAAGGRTSAEGRHLILIRNIDWSQGVKTRAELKEFEEGGGSVHRIDEEDLRTFAALEEMLTSQSYELLEWLVSRRPASRSTLLGKILPQIAGSRQQQQSQQSQPEPEPESAEFSPTTIRLAGGVSVDLATLRKHVVVFAGSGSGKTVLMRRIVEECALRGVSAIVLDPNNDLARLGDPWPAAPTQWAAGDAALAADYLAGTDVVVWTPGRASGRPLSFQPLPDFAGVLDDPDEFAAAVDAAVATLVPHAKVNGTTPKASRGKAVLVEALTHYARSGGQGLPGFVDLLSDLPDGVSQLSAGHTLAADLAETLKAAMVNNPLLGGTGAPADPAVLLTPAPGKRARVSVISFVGLPSDEQRQAFVNQLQLAVFAWAKRHPAGERPLGGLLVMDEAQTIAPSSPMTASTYSTIMLASQARKYGLGLLLATQAPKGLHNQITGNATTQFFGLLNSPVQIAAANDMAKAKGSDVGDISQLKVGQFYAASEKFGFRLIRSPFCLSHHPSSPLRIEEVLERAKDDR